MWSLPTIFNSRKHFPVMFNMGRVEEGQQLVAAQQGMIQKRYVLIENRWSLMEQSSQFKMLGSVGVSCTSIQNLLSCQNIWMIRSFLYMIGTTLILFNYRYTLMVEALMFMKSFLTSVCVIPVVTYWFIPEFDIFLCIQCNQLHILFCIILYQ